MLRKLDEQVRIFEKELDMAKSAARYNDEMVSRGEEFTPRKHYVEASEDVILQKWPHGLGGKKFMMYQGVEVYLPGAYHEVMEEKTRTITG